MKNAVLSSGKLKKFDPSGPAPTISGPEGHGGKAPVTRPNSPDSTKNRVLLTEGSTKHSGAGKFTAPRKEGSHDPAECGYTKPGKM